ncbi:MAG: hypothetical protein E6K98_03965 [Thaumarchaeota archaeon]|nr:MAG: hypothetical protein E6K98_03965 [Nitrososphaerota archaeon]TLX95633.1 MAG: hypothetical protein E6K91_02215 [Nitrososphaerota archaeon]
MFGRPLIVRNVSATIKVLNIDKIMIPEDFPDALRLVQDEFPRISVEQFHDDGDSNQTSTFPTKIEKITITKNNNFEIPINTLLRYSPNTTTFSTESISYPWDLLNTIKNVLHDEVTHRVISPKATISKSSIIDGPCIIEDNVTIDDFCKIKGPIYLGKDSFIGMGSLVRYCMISNETRIGFNCEISKCYFGDNVQTSHHNVILDSVIGKNVWFGGYSGTANVLLTRKNIKYMINDELIDTGTDHFGAMVGDNCAIGASVIVLPGRQVPADTTIQAGTIFGKNN